LKEEGSKEWWIKEMRIRWNEKDCERMIRKKKEEENRVKKKKEKRE
jgi:hypothetical protein